MLLIKQQKKAQHNKNNVNTRPSDLKYELIYQPANCDHFWPLWCSTSSFVCSSVCFNTSRFLSSPYHHVFTSSALL